MSLPSETLVKGLQQACSSLIDSIGLSLVGNSTQEIRDGDAWSDLGVVHFEGGGLSGYVALCCSSSVLVATHPLKNSALTAVQMNDWLTEVVNRLAGAFKQQLVSAGVVMESRVARVAAAKQTWIYDAQTNSVKSHQIVTNKGEIAVYLCASETKSWGDEPKEGALEIVGDPGSLTLF